MDKHDIVQRMLKNAKDKMDHSKKLKTITLSNDKGMTIKVLNLGAKIMSIMAPDRNGHFDNIVLGYPTPDEYVNGDPYFGAIVGRCANRIANAEFWLDGKKYRLPQNAGTNHLHGGPNGFHNQFWDLVSQTHHSEFSAVKFRYLSRDMEEGYPGNLEVFVRYSLTNENKLHISYEAHSDKKTIVNLTHHSFFNLKDGGKSNIHGHVLNINADRYTPMDSEFITTGELATVDGTPMDFRQAIKIGERIESDFDQIVLAGGYDHNYVLNPTEDTLNIAAEVIEPESGRKMEVLTSEPGMQLYTGNFIAAKAQEGKANDYKNRSAFCLEAQHFPNSPNHPHFPSVVLCPGAYYLQTTIYKFSCV